MNAQADTTIDETLVDTAVAEMPQEVQDFLWSDAFDLIVRGIRHALSLPDDQEALVKDAAEDLLLGIATMEDVFRTLRNAGVSEEVAVKILYAIDTEIIARAENITEFFSPSEDEETDEKATAIISSVSPISATQPQDVLEILKTRLTQAKTVAPTQRQVDMDISAHSSASAPVEEKRAIDPYRMRPEK